MKDPPKQEKVSRQSSSILKLPKQRQPLQCVAPDPSTSDTSPTIKIKRRVSFAKNKRIREFCNEAEQGTVWDDTYEEHDLSSTKSSGNNTDSPMIITVHCDDKENFPVQLFLPTDQVGCKEVSVNIPVERNNDNDECEMEVDNSVIDRESQVNQNIDHIEYPDATIYCNDGMDMTALVPGIIIPGHSQEVGCFDDTLLVTRSRSLINSMEITENVPSVSMYESPLGQNKSVGLNPNCNTHSTELTQAISTILSVGCLKRSINKTELEEAELKKNASFTVPIEFTSVIPSSTMIRPDSPDQIEDNTKNVAGEAMEFMEVKPSTLQNDVIQVKDTTKNITSKTMELSEAVLPNNPNKIVQRQEIIRDFASKTMEFTETAPPHFRNEVLHIDNCTENLTSKTMEFTKAVPTCYNNKILQEKEITRNLASKTMEFTETVPPHFRDKVLQIDNCEESLTSKTMEFTKAVPSCYINKIFQEKEITKNLASKTMEFTEIVHPHFQNEVSQVHDCTKNLTSKTMEFTKAVPSCYNNEKLQEKEITRNLASKTMEFTETVPPHFQDKVLQIDNCTENLTSKTMEFTKAVPTCYNNKILQEKEITKNLASKTMEFTEIVHPHFQDEVSQVHDCTKNLTSKTMEFTKAVPSCYNNEKLQEKEITRNLVSKTMEFTETVPPHFQDKVLQIEHCEENLTSKTMEFTKAVATCYDDNILQEKEITRNVASKTMEFTEIVHPHFQDEVSQVDDCTKNLTSKTMEFTKAVPSCYNNKNLQEKEITRNLASKTMEFTETVPPHFRDNVLQIDNCEESLTSKTMEFTKAVPSCYINKIFQEKEITKNLASKTMEFTEIVHPHFQDEVSQVHDCTKNLTTETMEYTKAVSPSYQNKHSQNIPNNSDTVQEHIEPITQTSEDGNNPIAVIPESIVPISTSMRKGDQCSFDSNKENVPAKPMKSSETAPSDNQKRNRRNSVNVSIINPNESTDHRKEESMQNEASDDSNTRVQNSSNKISQELLKRHSFEDRSLALNDIPMEFTSVIPGLNWTRMCQDEAETEKINSQNSEFTEAVCSRNYDGTSNGMHLETSIIEKQLRNAIYNTKTSNYTESFPTKFKSVIPSFDLNERNTQNIASGKTENLMSETIDSTEAKPLCPDKNSKISVHTGELDVQNIIYNDNFSQEVVDVTSSIPMDFTSVITDSNLKKTNFQVQTNDRTENLTSKTMDFTEAVSSCNRNQISKIKNCGKLLEKSESIINQTMEFTEAISSHNLTHMLLVENLEELQKNGNLASNTMDFTEAISARNREKVHHNTPDFGNNSNAINHITMERLPAGANSNLAGQYDQCQERREPKDMDDMTMEFTVGVPPAHQNKRFYNNSTNYNVSHSAQLSTTKNPNNLSILSNRLDTLQRSINTSNNNFSKRNNCDVFDRFSTREETFHRITSDELNTLCASMNLPTSKYAKEESITAANDFIPLCNDVNILRDSLKKNGILHQKATDNRNDFTVTDKSMNTQEKTCTNYEKNNGSRMDFDVASEEQTSTGIRREATVNIPSIVDLSSVINRSISAQKHLLTLSTSAKDIDETMQITKNLEHNQIPSISVDIFHDEINVGEKGSSQSNHSLVHIPPNTCENSNNENSPYVNANKRRAIDGISKSTIIDTHTCINFSNLQSCPGGESGTTQENICVDQNSQEFNSANVSSNIEENKTSNIQIYHDTSVGFVEGSSKSKRKFYEIDDSNNKNVPSINSGLARNPLKTIKINNEIDNHISEDNSLSRLPSDNTDVLIATMGFKTKLSYPLIINEQTTIKISQKSFVDKTYTIDKNIDERVESSRTCSNINKNMNMRENADFRCPSDVQNSNDKNEDIIKDINPSFEINEGSQAKNSNDLYETNQELGEKLILHSLHLEELEEIEPPSFLDSDSVQEDLDEKNEKDEVQNEFQSSNIFSLENDENTPRSQKENNVCINKSNVQSLNICLSTNDVVVSSQSVINTENLHTEKYIHTSTEEQLSKNIMNSSTGKINNCSQNSFENHDQSICQDDSYEEVPLSPFLLLSQKIIAYKRSNDCIWSIQAMTPEIVAINYISKSFMVVFQLDKDQNDSEKIIKEVQFLSRLRANSKNILLRIVHDLLLSKLNALAIMEKYRAYKDILPVLECISEEVILMMNFMFDIERLSAFNLMKIHRESSIQKANIILKISMMINTFTEISPNDIDVVCVLGSIRISDIKQLIVNIKRDFKFLSRYINDVKEYITLMEESSCLKNH